MAIWKKIAYIVGFSLLGLFVALSAILIAINTINWNRHTRLISNVVERVSDWKVERLGGIQIHINSQFLLTLKDFHLHNALGTSSLRDVKGNYFGLQLQVRPLIFHQNLIVDDVSLRSSSIVLRQTPVEEPTDWGSLIENMPSLFVASAQIEDLDVTYLPLGPVRPWNIAVDTFSMMSPSQSQPIKINTRGQIDKVAFHLSGTLGSFENFLDYNSAYPYSLNASVAEETLDLQGTLDHKRTIYTLRGEAKGGDLSPYFDIAHVPMAFRQVPAYQIKTSLAYNNGRLSIDAFDGKLGGSRVNGSLTADYQDDLQSIDLKVSDANFRYRDFSFLIPAPKPVESKYELELSNLSVKADSETTPIAFKAKGGFNDLPFDTSGSLGSLANLRNKDDFYPMSVRFALDGKQIDLSAKVRSEDETYKAEILAKGNNLSPLLQYYDRKYANMKSNRFQFSFQASYSPNHFVFGNVRARYGKSHLRGGSTIDTSAPNQSFRLALDQSEIYFDDIDSLIGDGGAAKPSSGINKFRIHKLVLSSQNPRQKIQVRGSAAVDRFTVSLNGEMGSMKTFENARLPYPIDLKLAVQGQSLVANALLDRTRETYRVHLKAEGQNAEPLLEALQVKLPGPGPLPTYDLAMSLNYHAPRLSIEDLRARLGSSRMEGEAQLLMQKRPNLTVQLRSPLLNTADFQAFIAPAKEVSNGPLFSPEVLNLSWLKFMDAKLNVGVAAIKGGVLGRLVQDGEIRAQLRNGVLDVQSLNLGVAKGTIAGNMQLDANRKPTAIEADVGVSKIDLKTLIAPFVKPLADDGIKPKELVSGKLYSTVSLRTSGESIKDFASNLNGSARVSAEGGHIGLTLVELLGFDITQTVTSWFRDIPPTPLQCAIVLLDVRDGTVRSRDALVATEDSNIWGEGYVDLRRERVDYRIRTRPKDFSIGSVRTPVELKGPLQDMDVKINKRGIILRGAAAVALGVLVNPAAAVLPFIEPGLGKEGQCQKYESQLADIRVDSQPSSAVTTR